MGIQKYCKRYKTSTSYIRASLYAWKSIRNLQIIINSSLYPPHTTSNICMHTHTILAKELPHNGMTARYTQITQLPYKQSNKFSRSISPGKLRDASGNCVCLDSDKCWAGFAITNYVMCVWVCHWMKCSNIHHVRLTLGHLFSGMDWVT